MPPLAPLLAVLAFAPPSAVSTGSIVAAPDDPFVLFDGTLDGWTGEKRYWSVETVDGEPEVVGRSPGLDHNTFLTRDEPLGDFDLTFQVKLTPPDANSGVQFRSERIAEDGEKAGPDSEMRGYQADIGRGWWGKLYEENGRGMLFEDSADDAVKHGGWNTYRVRAVGHEIRTWLNGTPSVRLTDPDGATDGLLALQIHSGGPMEVRFRRFALERME